MSWSWRNAVIYGSIAIASTAGLVYLIRRRRKKLQANALMEEASDLNYFIEYNTSSSSSQGSKTHLIAPAPYVSSEEVEGTVSMVREMFEGRYDVALNDALFQRSCRRLFDRFATGRLPPSFDHPMERSVWETMIKHLISVADGIHDPAVTPKQETTSEMYDLYADIGTLFVCAAMFSIRPAFFLPLYGSDAQWRQIKMHLTSSRIEKITLPSMRWPYWFKLALKNPLPSDRTYALYFYYLWRLDHFSEAQQILQKATSLKLQNCTRLYAIISAYRGDVDGAQKILGDFLEENPDDLNALALKKRLSKGISDQDLLLALFEIMVMVHSS